MDQKLKNRLTSARRQFNALPDKEDHDYFSVCVYFVQREPGKIHLMMEAAAVKHSDQTVDFEESDITFLGKDTVLGELHEDYTKIMSFLKNVSEKYPTRTVVFFPRQLVTYHGLDGKTKFTVSDLLRIIRYSVSHKDFTFWGDEVGFRIDCNR